MSPSNVQKYVDVMIREFSALDPAHAADYKTRGEAYKKQLQGVRDELVKEISTLPENQRALVTCEGAFSYLAADAGLKEKYIWAVNSEQQATPSQISSAIDYVRENQVPAVFCESTVSDNPMRQVADATGRTIRRRALRGLALRGERPRAHLPGHDPLRRTYHRCGPQGQLLNPA